MKLTPILLISFILALAATTYFTLQLSRSTPPPPAGLLAADKSYGVTIDLTQYDDATLIYRLTSLHEYGLTWIRQPIRWAEIEVTPGQFDWQQIDRIFAAIALENKTARVQSQPLKLIAVLHTTPAWARPPETPSTTPPTHRNHFGNFARAFATRYGKRINHYQIWHEPNLSANWGNAFVDPLAYADLLQEATLNIRTADPEAIIITAALAPTLENGPLNLNEIDYLDQLYRVKGNQWFDIVAGQPYGIKSEPSDPARVDTLNFSRLELLRRVMLKHGDFDTPIWATAFGWNALPTNWTGPKSPWKTDTPSTQARRTAQAIKRARRDWPWLGPMLAVRWDTTGLANNDPARGFALLESPLILEAIRSAATADPTATPGHYPANHPSGYYNPGWRFALTNTDIPRHKSGTLIISFEGTRLDLTVNRGPYRGYLWVTVDGQPANVLSQDGQGRSYIVLYDPLCQSETVTLAQHLALSRHKAAIKTEGGWGQWAVSGWTVYHETDTRFLQIGLTVTGLLATLSGLGLLRSLFRTPTEVINPIQIWSKNITTWYVHFGDRGQIAITFLLAIGFYLTPSWVALPLILPLVLAILLRPDLGLALIAFSLSFLSIPTPLPIINLSPIELLLIFTTTGFLLKKLLSQSIINYQLSIINYQSFSFAQDKSPISNPKSKIQNPKSTDWAILTLLILALMATLFAQNFGVSMFEWRTVILPSVVFYFLIRLGLDFNPQSPITNYQLPAWAWRLVDAFVAGATLQAATALYFYFFAGQFVTAEGVHRAVGAVYASPNHLSLFLGRVWPILLVVSILSGQTPFRRWFYGASLAIVSTTLYLTFSKGALLLGLPTSVVTIAMFYGFRHRGRYWRRAIVATVGGLLAVILTLIPFSRTTRFLALFDVNQGSTGFFRLKLWQSSLTMLRDHWLLGVGLDNFLYQYRTYYILPEAWQEPNLSHPHNLILDFGTRLGIGGIVVLLWLQLTFWANAWQLYKKQPSPLILGLMGSMAVFLSHGLVDNSYFLVDLALAFFLTVGIVQGLAD